MYRPQLELSAAFSSSNAGGGSISFDAFSRNGQPGPTTDAFLLGEPIALDYSAAAFAYGAFDLTNGTGGTALVAPSPVFPTYLSGYVGLGCPLTNAGVDLGSAPCTAAGAPGSVTRCCDLGRTIGNYRPALSNSFDLLFTYTQTDAGSTVNFTTVPSTTMPEPSTLVLAGVGSALVGVAAVRRRRQMI